MQNEKTSKIAMYIAVGIGAYLVPILISSTMSPADFIGSNHTVYFTLYNIIYSAIGLAVPLVLIYILKPVVEDHKLLITYLYISVVGVGVLVMSNLVVMVMGSFNYYTIMNIPYGIITLVNVIIIIVLATQVEQKTKLHIGLLIHAALGLHSFLAFSPISGLIFGERLWDYQQLFYEYYLQYLLIGASLLAWSLIIYHFYDKKETELLEEKKDIQYDYDYE